MTVYDLGPSFSRGGGTSTQNRVNQALLGAAGAGRASSAQLTADSMRRVELARGLEATLRRVPVVTAAQRLADAGRRAAPEVLRATRSIPSAEVERIVDNAARGLYTTSSQQRIQDMVDDGGGEPFGLGGGATDQIFDATAGGIRGNVVALLQASEVIAADQTTSTIDADTAFTSNDQSRVGSVGRLLEQLMVDISVAGTMPSGYDADSLRKYLLGVTYLQPEIGGVPQTQIPVGMMTRTDFLRTAFGFRAILDPGNFPSLSFNWSSDAIIPPPPAANTWTASLNIIAIFSAPRRYR
jgi:hypothetical protein